MKKLFLYVFLGLLWCNVGFANRLGIEAKKLDINFDCELAKDILADAGVPSESIKKTSERQGIYKFGYKKYNRPDADLVLLHLDYSREENKYFLPDSVASKWKSEEKGVKYYLKSYVYGGGYLAEIINKYYGEEKYVVFHYLFKVDKENSNKFDKKLTEMIRLPDDAFVTALILLTHDYYDYALKNKGKHLFIAVPYHCKSL